MAVLCFAGTAMAQTELLQNAGFEMWDGDKPVHWVSTTTAGNGTLSRSLDARTDSSSVMVKGASSNKRLAYEEMTLSPGSYTFSIYAKAATDEAAKACPGYAPVKEDGSMGTYVYGDYVDVSSAEWTLVSYTFALEEETKLNLVVMNSKDPGKDLLLDDASLTTSDGGVVEGGESPEPEPEPEPEPDPGLVSFVKATSITSGQRYVIVALENGTNNVAENIAASDSYGYLSVTDAAAGDEIAMPAANAFTITEGTGGYLIQDSYGRYLYMTGTYNSFNVMDSLPESGALWTISFDGDGLATITNVDMNKWVQYDVEYGSFGSYPDARGILPSLYVEDGEAPEPEVPENESSKENPYTVAETMSKYDASIKQADVWVSGYIVGYVNGTSIAAGAVFGAEAPEGGTVSATNLLIADDVNVADYTQCLAVQLPAGIIREALNLQANPENLGKQVVLKGSLETYFGVCGLKSPSEYVLEGEESPDPSVDISNTPETAYTVAKAHELIEAGDGLAAKVYVKGVITGIDEVSTSFGNATYYINDSEGVGEAITVFRGYYFGGARFTSEDQIKVGDEVVVYGQLTVYNGEHQVNQGSSIYSLNGETESDIPSTSNTPETAYTVAKVQELIQAGEGLMSPVYVKGVITEIDEVSTQYGNATYYINDTETTEGQLQVFRGKYFDGEKFTAEDQIKVGDEIIVYGTLVLYGGNTPEITDSRIYSLNGETATGVMGGVAEENAPVEVYTLGGVKVGNSLEGLQKGIYVVKQGNKVVKVMK